MGLLKRFLTSRKKSRELRRIELDLTPSDDLADDLLQRMRSPTTNKVAVAEDELLNLCIADQNIAEIMRLYGLSRDDLREIYGLCLANGLGYWVKGHFEAASTIAYPEPLMFFVECRQRGKSPYVALDSYWRGEIPQGGLGQILQSGT